jgi:hypothetical protein
MDENHDQFYFSDENPDWAFFSIRPDQWEFPNTDAPAPAPSSGLTQEQKEYLQKFLDSMDAAPMPNTNYSNLQGVSPSMLRWFVVVAESLNHALYNRIASRKGRLSDIFTNIREAVHGVSSAPDLTDKERAAFLDFCRDMGEVLRHEVNNGLWLTDTEEDMVDAMCKGMILDDYYT